MSPKQKGWRQLQAQLHLKRHFLLLLKIILESCQKIPLITMYVLKTRPRVSNNLPCWKLSLAKTQWSQSSNVSEFLRSSPLHVSQHQNSSQHLRSLQNSIRLLVKNDHGSQTFFCKSFSFFCQWINAWVALQAALKEYILNKWQRTLFEDFIAGLQCLLLGAQFCQ